MSKNKYVDYAIQADNICSNTMLNSEKKIYIVSDTKREYRLHVELGKVKFTILLNKKYVNQDGWI